MTTADTHSRPSLLDQPDTMRACWEVVDRGVLVELLRDAGSHCREYGDTPGANHRDWLADQAEAGKGGILTRERWEGTG